jgi:hypothetical protein
MRVRMVKVLTMGMLAGGLMLSTASAFAGELAASGCHLGNHPHAHVESSWAWLLLLLLPLALRGRLLGRKRR